MKDYEVKVLMNLYDKIKEANPFLGNESIKNIYREIVEKIEKDGFVKTEVVNIVFQIYSISRFAIFQSPPPTKQVKKETVQISSDPCSGGINRRGGC